jgi:protein N-terminal methyltransferase
MNTGLDIGRYAEAVLCLLGSLLAQLERQSCLQADDVPADVDGVLGGQAHIAPMDVAESRLFLTTLQRDYGLGAATCLDCGSGIGRVTKDVLRYHFSVADVLEQSEKMLSAAKLSLAAANSVISDAYGVARHFFGCGLQDLDSVFAQDQVQEYDCIWLQWVIGCVTDVDLICFLQHAFRLLRPNGVVVFKDNYCGKGWAFNYDAVDHSISRSRPYLETLLQLAQAEIVYEKEQTEWDPELLPVHMLALRERPSTAATFLANRKKDAIQMLTTG